LHKRPSTRTNAYMKKIELSYEIRAQRTHAASLHNPLLDMLQALQQSGSISGAAKALGLSYRHAWGELKRWEEELGQGLVHWERGQRAQLTEFATKLLWAERQAQARLAPQIEALRADIERAFSVAFDDSAHVLTLYASHDHALPLLRDFCAPRGLHVDVRFMGSVDAVAQLNAGRCVMAGFHCVSQPSAKSLTARSYKPLLKPGLHKLIGFAQRSQGLMVAPGNPLRVQGLADLARPDLRFANRAAGAGTRVLLDDLLAQAGLRTTDINGYSHEEPSHAAVAQAIVSGGADVGLGLEAAASQARLGFVPLLRERYYLVCLKNALASPPVQALLGALADSAWEVQLAGVRGYASDNSGLIQSLKTVLPWWQLPARAK
jgi:putative molybdopterin biosynthesis protein